MQNVINLFNNIYDLLLQENKKTSSLILNTQSLLHNKYQYRLYRDILIKSISHINKSLFDERPNIYSTWDKLSFEEQLRTISLAKKYSQNWFLK